MQKIKNYFIDFYKRHFARKSAGQIVIESIMTLFCMTIACSYLYILIWCFINSLKTGPEVVLEPFGLPKVLHWENYKNILSELEVQRVSFFGMLFNSIYFSVGGALISTYITALFAYVTTKYKFPGSNLIATFVFIKMFLPLYGTSAAEYKMYFNIGLLNSYAFIITACGAMTVNYLYFRAMYKTLSGGTAEAAEIDGANDFQIWWNIILPQSMGLMTAIFIMSWMQTWGDYTTPLLYLRRLPSLAVGLYMFEQETVSSASKHILYAGCVIISIPPIVLYSFSLKTLTENVTIGAMKE